MKQAHAYMNHGRWLVRCPVHNKGAAQVKPPIDKYIPPCCHPDIVAGFQGVVKGRVQYVPDTSARKTARIQAEAAGDVYEVVFPDNWRDIESVLSRRPVENRNWTPGETLAGLHGENVAYLEN